MTILLNPIIKKGVPKYLSISEEIIKAVRNGSLLPGTRLPTHRELAEQLGVSVQTVSNAYAHAEKIGVVEAWIGSGTFVCKDAVDDTKETEFMLAQEVKTSQDEIDMSIAHPVFTEQHTQLFNEALIQIAGQKNNEPLIGAAKPVAGQRHHIEAGQHYLSSQSLMVEHERLLLTNGASHGLALALSSAVNQGDTMACGRLVDHGLISRSRIFGFKLHPLESDEKGILPESFEQACQTKKIAALNCTPSMANPTSAHMDLARREAIAEVALRYNVTVIEDDVYGALEPDRVPPLSSLIPELAFYVTSLTKTVAPGLRTGYLVVPRHMMQHAIGRLAATSWTATPLPFEIASLWIANGTINKLIQFQQQEFSVRQAMARDILSDFSFTSHPNGQHIWLNLPEGWHSEELLGAASRSGVKITSYRPFVIDNSDQPKCVRLSLGAESNREYIRQGLGVVADIIHSSPPPSHFLL
ncbi:PLP-dependent aminotransferase family protein [Parasalinivibrio latis]|uniref:MocR-like ectoine utilization transcription factor EhuR n=1 Tax=Parasalinivibrio latis TaxID=2952610 RepID=UPI0030E1571E